MKHPTLLTQSIVRLVLILLGIGLLFGLSLTYYLRFLLEAEVSDKANLIFSNVLAMETYVRDTLRPAMYETLPQDAFILEAMSTSYVTRRLMSDLNMSKNQFTFRRVALDPRNPEYGANAMERELIAYFQANPTVSSTSKYLKRDGKEFLVMAQPAVFNQSCLRCHGRPEDAPGVLRSRYGSVRGFGRFEGEIGGLDSLIMPVEREAAAIRKISLGFILVFICGTVLILSLSHFTFDRIMVSNIRRLSALMRSRFPAEADKTLGKSHDGKSDEIEGMLDDMERFADHLREAKEQLSDHAATLEAKVRERTAEVSQEADARQADVRLFLGVLELFITGADRSSLLMRVLEAVMIRFGADSVYFHCLFSLNTHIYPPDAEPGELTEDQRDTLLEGKGLFSRHEALVPVQSTDTIRGALHLRWSAGNTLPAQEEDVLLAVGRQLGIALENLEAMENLLRQKAVLESIFEGIADPLLLLDGSGDVLHANESGHQLMAALSTKDGNSDDIFAFGQLAADVVCNGPAIQREIVLPNGLSLMLRAYPLCGFSNPSRIIVFARDNTLEKTMLAKLQQSEKSMAMGILAAGLAHEINNPLGVILCYARLLWNNGKSEQAEDLGIIIHHTLQARRVLSDLMRFASPKREAVNLVNLAEVVEFIARVFQVKAVKTEVAIETAIPADLPLIRGNASALEQVLTNLLLNSIDALDEQAGEIPGRILITARHDVASGEVLLRVQDNGPGIPDEHLTRIFDPFFTTKDVGKGTGLGLCVVYGLVRDLGGRIEVDAGKGARFTIHLQTERDTEYA
jgi:signal transduction histidine kinase/PAS domain-containing protein